MDRTLFFYNKKNNFFCALEISLTFWYFDTRTVTPVSRPPLCSGNAHGVYSHFSDDLHTERNDNFTQGTHYVLSKRERGYYAQMYFKDTKARV